MRTGRSFPSSAFGRYRDALATPGAPRFFIPAAIGRVGVAMSSLAVLWGVQSVAGSFAQAGVATGAFAIADAAVGPQVARLIDRWGQRRIASLTASIFVGAVLLLAWGCSRGWLLGVLVGLAALAGASAPPVGALSAARWRQVVGGTDRLPAALALEGSVNDMAFLIGPVLVTTLGATVAGWTGLILAAGLVTVSMIGLLTGTESEPPPGADSPGRLIDHRLLTRPFVALFVANLSIGFFFGGVPVAITAFCLGHGSGAWAGVIAAVSSLVSLTAGLVYGGVRRAPPVIVMTAASVVLTVGSASLTWVPNLPLLVVGYGLVGGCVALILIPASVLLPRITPGGVYTQAMVWTNTASAIGIAVAAPIVGGAVEWKGWPAGFLTTAVLTAALPLTLLVNRSTLKKVAGRDRPNREPSAAGARGVDADRLGCEWRSL